MTPRGLTLTRPMAAAIVHGSKRIENRTTVVAVHAGEKWDDNYATAIEHIDGPSYHERRLDRGIVGLMRLTGRVYVRDESLSPKIYLMNGREVTPDEPGLARFSGPFGYEIDLAAAFPVPIPCRGMQGFWPVPADAIAAMRAQVNAYRADGDLVDLFHEFVDEVPPCKECDSPEGCESDCSVAPWNMETS